MPLPSGMQLPPPSDWQEFQRMCCDLWKRIWNNTNIQEYGRIGQRQNGVDIYGIIDNGNRYGGVQCKEKDNLSANELTIQELVKEVNKAKRFSPKLSEFILSYTGPRDKNLQDKANRLTKKNKHFTVIVWSWEDIKLELTKYQDLLEKYYPTIFASTFSNDKSSKEIIFEISEQITSTRKDIREDFTGVINEEFTKLAQNLVEKGGAELEAEIVHVKKLIDDYKPKTCLEFIEDLIKKKWDVISEKSKFKLLTNKASCFLQLGNLKDASALFIQALQYNKDDEKALVNTALGYFLIKETETTLKFIDEAFQKNPMNLEAWSLKIQISKNSAELKEVWEKIPKNLLEKMEINWAYGVTLQREGLLNQAEKFIEVALKNDTERRIDLIVQLSNVKLQNCIDEVKLVATRQLTSEVKDRLESTESLLNEALKRLTTSDIVPIRIQAIICRGVVKSFLDKIEPAKKDLDQGIEWDPTNYQAVRHRAILSVEDGVYEEAVNNLKPFTIDGENYDAKILLADTYRLAKKQYDSIKILKGCEVWQSEEKIKLNGLEILAECYLELADKDSALATVEKMKLLKPTSFIHFLFQAKIEKHFSNKDNAKRILQLAKSRITNEIDLFNEWKLANELYEMELFADAADICERLAEPQKNDNITRLLIESHFKSEQLEKSLDYCSRLLSVHPNVQYATEISSVIFEETGNLPAAIETLQKYLEIKPDDNHSRLRLVNVLRRYGDNTEADNEIVKIKYPEKLNPREILLYAHHLAFKGELDNAIKILYEAKRNYSNDPEIDMAYISLILGRNEIIPIMEKPVTISVDTVVFLENDNLEKEHYLIEDRKNVDFLKKEIDVDSPIAKELLGRKVGDKIDIEKNPIQPREWIVREIKSKYAHALHESLNSHPKRFSDRQDLVPFTTPTDENGEIDTNRFKEQMLSVLPERSNTELIERFYKEGTLTIGGIANVMGVDSIASFVFLSTKQNIGIISSSGSQKEYQYGYNNIAFSNGIVIEPTSIFTMDYLKIKEKLNEKYGPFVVAQSTLDEFNKILALRSVGGSQPGLTIFKERGELYKIEITVEDKKKYNERIESIIEWVRKNCKILPVNLAISFNKNEREQYYKFFGVPSFDSLLLAKENALLFYTDDGNLRGLAEREHGVKGIWTHCLINDALSKEYINRTEYDDYTILLLKINVHHVSISAQTLFAAGKKVAWKYDDYTFASVLFNLTGIRCNEISALIVAEEFLYLLWTEALAPLTRDIIVLSLFDALVVGRNRQGIIDKIEIIIHRRFQLWPFAENALISILNTWKKTRMM